MLRAGNSRNGSAERYAGKQQRSEGQNSAPLIMRGHLRIS
jgi:hypothetical protein